MAPKWKLIVITFCVTTKLIAVEKGPMDSFFDPKTDYSVFSGRITDKDDSGHISRSPQKTTISSFLGPVIQ